MKILLTGGGTGGHFYPIIAVAQELNNITKERKILQMELIYMASVPYDKHLLFVNGIKFERVPAGKIRRYFSIKNVTDVFVTIYGVLKALWRVFSIYPDVIFGKGGFDSFPALFAGYILRIPVVIHESDSKPGKVNLWAGKFAKRIAVGFSSTVEYFDKNKVAFTGNPIRQEMLQPQTTGAHEFLGLEKNIPVVLVLGGSQGSRVINEHLLDLLPKLLTDYQVIHQTGVNLFDETKNLASVILENNTDAHRYRPFSYLNDLALKMAAGSANLIISRAGAGAISEISVWGIPSLLIPLTAEVSHDQRHNAFAYARSGGAVVIEEDNLEPNILFHEINRILKDPKIAESMVNGSRKFARTDSARIIAEELVSIAFEHID